jgi:hypothetical protein
VATIVSYVNALRARQDVIARKFGSDIARADKVTRVLNMSLIVLLAVIVKTLVDKGLVTDAELLGTLNEARDDEWPDEPAESSAS